MNPASSSGESGANQYVPGRDLTNGHQLNLEQFKRTAGNRSLRETMADYNATSLSIELVGTRYR